MKWKLEVLKDVELGERKELTFKDALKMYEESKKSISFHSTIRTYVRKLNKIFKTNIALHSLRTHHIELLVNELREQPLKEQTIKHCINIIRGAIKYAKRMHFKVPDIDFPVITPEKHRIRYLNVIEEERLLKELDPKREFSGLVPYDRRPELMKKEMWDNHDIVIILLDTACRYTEIGKLKWKDVDMEKGVLKIWRGKTKNETHLLMSKRVKYTLRKRRDHRPNLKYVFTNRKGEARGYATLGIRKAFKRAGLKDFRIHDLRHSAASRLIQDGCTLQEVQVILGHASFQTTLKYAHLCQDTVTKKAKAIMDKRPIDQHINELFG